MSATGMNVPSGAGLAAPRTAAPGSVVPAGHYRVAGVLRAEFTKLRTLRSTTWSLLVTTVLTIGIGVLATSLAVSHWSQRSPIDRATFDPISRSLSGLLFAQLAIGVLGVLVMSGEYGTGTIRATLAAVPNRPLVLAAKTVVFGAVALVVSEVLSFCAFLIGQGIMSGTTPTASLGQSVALRAVIGGGLYLTVLGLFALGLATILRHTAGAISVFVGVLLILPLILQALPESIIQAVGKYLPANIGVSIMSTSGSRLEVHTFTPWVGLAILCGYAAAALLLGGWVMLRRDA